MRGTARPLLPLPHKAELQSEVPNFVEVDSHFGFVRGPSPVVVSRPGSCNRLASVHGVGEGDGLGGGGRVAVGDGDGIGGGGRVGIGVGDGVGVGAVPPICISQIPRPKVAILSTRPLSGSVCPCS